jgi:hypothetical protein
MDKLSAKKILLQFSKAQLLLTLCLLNIYVSAESYETKEYIGLNNSICKNASKHLTLEDSGFFEYIGGGAEKTFECGNTVEAGNEPCRKDPELICRNINKKHILQRSDFLLSNANNFLASNKKFKNRRKLERAIKTQTQINKDWASSSDILSLINSLEREIIYTASLLPDQNASSINNELKLLHDRKRQKILEEQRLAKQASLKKQNKVQAQQKKITSSAQTMDPKIFGGLMILSFVVYILGIIMQLLRRLLRRMTQKKSNDSLDVFEVKILSIFTFKYFLYFSIVTIISVPLVVLVFAIPLFFLDTLAGINLTGDWFVFLTFFLGALGGWAVATGNRESDQRKEYFRAHEEALGDKWSEWSALIEKFIAFQKFIKMGKPSQDKWLASEEALSHFTTLYIPFRTYCINDLGLKQEATKHYMTENDPKRKCAHCGLSYGLQLVKKETLRASKSVSHAHTNKDGSKDSRFKNNPTTVTKYGEFSSLYRCYDCSAETLFATEFKTDPTIHDMISTALLVKPGKDLKKESIAVKVETKEPSSQPIKDNSDNGSDIEDLFDDI